MSNRPFSHLPGAVCIDEDQLRELALEYLRNFVDKLAYHAGVGKSYDRTFNYREYQVAVAYNDNAGMAEVKFDTIEANLGDCIGIRGYIILETSLNPEEPYETVPFWYSYDGGKLTGFTDFSGLLDDA